MEKTLTLKEIAAALGCHTDSGEICTNISTDSRTIQPGSVFVAICGDKFDGHKFVASAFEKGAVAAVISKKEYAVPEKECYLVPDTKVANIALGGLYRSKFKELQVVAITGSIGKTTTKDMVACALAPFGQTAKTIGNQNNEIGFPNTLYALKQTDKMLVAEMGMSGFHEIEPMTVAARPNVAVITNIGVAHLQAMGTRENILKEKCDIALGLVDPGVLIINADNDLLGAIDPATGVPGAKQVLHYGVHATRLDYRAVHITPTGDGMSFDVEGPGFCVPCHVPALGEHHVQNAVAAVAVAHVLGLSPAVAATGINNYAPSGKRQRITHCKDNVVVIEDCYNASPESMETALGVLKEYFGTGRTIAFLADMLELGDDSQKMHESVGEKVATLHIDVLIAYGQQAKYMARRAEQCGVKTVLWGMDKNELLNQLQNMLQPGDAVLFKGSHSMALETVSEQLIQEFRATER